MFKKIISLFLSLSLIVTQPIFAQGVAQLNLAQYLGQARLSAIDNFRPTQLRYFSYDNLNDSFRILLDKGDAKDIKDNQLKEEAKELMDYFLIGLTLPNDAFWVNLRPDSPDNIIDPELEKTDLGRILLEADLQLKKDTAGLTSPQTPEGKAYWDKLYKKAGELFPAAGGSAFGGGSENITIPTLTRPWIVPGEIIVRESQDSAYIYKATLKVLLEQDHLKDSSVYNFSDPRLKELNEYSSQIIRETIIPKLTQEVNSSKRYAQLRQVYYSLVLSRWFKQKWGTRATAHQSPSADYISLIDSGNLTNLTAKEPYDKLTYFKQYQESFAQGEYNLKEPVYTPYGQSIRTYVSGGFTAGNEAMIISGVETTVVSSIIEESLKNGANIVPLEISGNSLQIVSSNQKQSKALAASPLTVGMVKSTIKTNMDAFFLNIRKTYKKKDGKDWDKELKELYDGFDPISTYEELTKWIDKAINSVKIAQEGTGIIDAHSGMIDTLKKIKKEVSKQEKPPAVASPLGKKMPVTDKFGNNLRYLDYWKLSDKGKDSLLKAFGKSFTEWGIKPADKNLRFAVRVNGANKITAVVGALQYNIATKEVGIRIVPEGVDKALEIESSLRETYIEEIRQGVRFWDNTFSSAAGSPLVEFVTGGVNSNKTIDASEEIGGTRIKEIEYRGRPEVYGSISKSGFKEILKKDNTFVLEKKLNHQRLAEPLLKVLKCNNDGNESFEYNNQKFTIETKYERAWSIFNDKKRGTNLRYIVTKTITGKTISFSGLLPYYINDYGFYGGDEAFRLEPKDIIDFFGITASSGLTSESRPSMPFGGIDFTGRAMRIGLEPMGSFADLKLVLPEVSNAAAIDLDNEFKQIQLMASSGIRPSDNRILEFAAACYYRGEFGPRLGEITSCLQQAHFLDERLGRESSEALRLATMLLEVM